MSFGYTQYHIVLMIIHTTYMGSSRYPGRVVEAKSRLGFLFPVSHTACVVAADIMQTCEIHNPG